MNKINLPLNQAPSPAIIVYLPDDLVSPLKSAIEPQALENLDLDFIPIDWVQHAHTAKLLGEPPIAQ